MLEIESLLEEGFSLNASFDIFPFLDSLSAFDDVVNFVPLEASWSGAFNSEFNPRFLFRSCVVLAKPSWEVRTNQKNIRRSEQPVFKSACKLMDLVYSLKTIRLTRLNYKGLGDD